MCVIIFKAANVPMPSYNIFEQCWDTNPDGFGMAVADGEKVTLSKGYMKLATAWKAAKDIPLDHAAVLHFRIGTSGKNDAPTCHPFPISNSKKALRQLQFDSLPFAVVHNGIISSKGEGNLSDTQVWVRDKLSLLFKPELVALPYHDKIVQMLLDDAAEAHSSRFAVLKADKECLMSGNWHSHDGLLFSNNNWNWVRPKTYGSYNSSAYGYGWWYGKDKDLDAPVQTAKEEKKSSYYDDMYDYYGEEYYDNVSFCPFCGSEDIVMHEHSQNNLCECFTCGAVYDARTGDEFARMTIDVDDRLDRYEEDLEAVERAEEAIRIHDYKYNASKKAELHKDAVYLTSTDAI